MTSLLLKLLVGPVVDAVVGVIKSNNEVKMDANRVKAELTEKVTKVIGDMSSNNRDVIVTEATSDDKWVRRWRPIVGLSSTFVLIWYALFVPIFVNWFGMEPLKVGDLLLSWIFTLASVGMGGYIASEAVIEVTKTIMRGTSRWRS